MNGRASKIGVSAGRLSMNAGDDDVRILNGLIGATLDSARHYKKVAGNVGNPSVRALFEHLSTERKSITQALQSQLGAISSNPMIESARNVSFTRRIFGNVRHAMDYGYIALIDEVERGEERVKAKYERALTNEKLSTLSRSVVQNAYKSVCAGCAQMHALKRYPNAERVHSERVEQW
ncbi:PA2169 family four-helix-bundle protein [Dyella monticola]|uniref:PA2169 family four-helix-bundle protein n=2 Tax=Dyella monticola TaxID=1927958 RepID=A0A370WXI8_9GAMM|nr:PA2169 family four-helix-bundle protein [Dyella monticola]